MVQEYTTKGKNTRNTTRDGVNKKKSFFKINMGDLFGTFWGKELFIIASQHLQNEVNIDFALEKC